jgi:Flp pilus assembly protein TadG
VRSRLDRIGRRLADERGSILPLACVMLLMLLGIAAFSLDIANYQQARRQAQNAADAAALAGAYDLPTSTTSASTDASSYVTKNFSGATPNVTVPYNSSSSLIHVVVTKTVNGIFGSIFGIGSETVTASATASSNSNAPATVIFSADTNCGDTDFTMPGSGNTFDGGVTDNGTMTIPGHPNTFTNGATYGGASNCSETVASGNTFGKGTTPTQQSSNLTWPYDPRSSLPACTYSATQFSWTVNGATLPSGVYCASQQIQVNASNLSGNVTLITPKITFSGSGVAFTPYWGNLIVYASGTGNCVSLPGSDLKTGDVFAPNCEIDIPGSGATLNGFIEGLDIKIDGSNNTFTGTGPPSAIGGNLALTG